MSSARAPGQRPSRRVAGTGWIVHSSCGHATLARKANVKDFTQNG
jgi:hypothetical protein